ncbi:MAG TPA: methylated-DNA--[protein]-cysteine S-methyltransferase [Caldimonas sp.]
MDSRGYTLFDTPIGACGIAWSERGVSGLQLPEATAGRTRARLLGRLPGTREASPPPPVRAAIAGIVALLQGEAVDLGAVELDETGVPPFHRRVYAVARGIGPGATLTYGAIAERLGEPGSARAVGQALGSNPFAIIVPCHRVLAAGGRIGGFSARGGAATKRKMLMIEQARFGDAPDLFDDLSRPDGAPPT